MENKIGILRRCPLFTSFSEKELEELYRGRFYEETFPAGAEICFREKGKERAGILLSGRAEVRTAENGSHVLLNRLDAGSLFGVTALYGSEPRTPTKIVAKTPATVLFLDQKTVDLLLADHRFAVGLVTFLADRTRFLSRKVASFSASSAEKRLAFFLLERSGESNSLLITSSFTVFCRELDLGRASLYRAFDALAEKGLIKKEGKTVFFPDRAALEKFYSL